MGDEQISHLEQQRQQKLERLKSLGVDPYGGRYAGSDSAESIRSRFKDDDDPEQGFEIVDHAVYAPTHNKKRRIKKEALGKIRRCQGCQDYTVRMRRREGPDFFVPSYKHPGRKKLKTVEYVTYEP